MLWTAKLDEKSEKTTRINISVLKNVPETATSKKISSPVEL